MLKARAAKRYPAAALENGWQGRAELRLKVSADGAVDSIAVRTSSGHAALDAAAVEMAALAAPQVPVPASLRGLDFGVDLPVIFSLR